MISSRVHGFLLVLWASSAAPAQSQVVYRSDVGSQSLDSRFEWATRQATTRPEEAYWIAYSVKRMMREDSWTGGFHDGRQERPTLAEVLKDTEGFSEEAVTLKDLARRALDQADRKRSDRIVEKEVVILMRFDGQGMREIDVSNIDLPFDLKDLPVYWLGSAKDLESVSRLVEIYHDKKYPSVREDIVAAVGMHEELGQAKSFLLQVIDSDAENDVRESAVFWLGRYESVETARYLGQLAENDRSEDVRENAVFALSRMTVDSALSHLIRLARSSDGPETRETARFWLSKKASDLLGGSDEMGHGPSPLQREALLALAHTDEDGGVSELIRLVDTHPDQGVRRQALFLLGQSDDARALDTIVRLLKPGS